MAVEPGERSEDPLPVDPLDPRPVVPHDDERRRPVDSGVQLDEPALGRELAGVGDEVRHDLLDATSVGARRPDPRREVGREPDAARGGEGRERGEGALADLGQRTGLDLEAQAARLDPAHLEEVADEGRRPLHDAAAALDELPRDLRIVQRSPREEIEVPAQAGQRRPELVGDHRHEPVALALPGPELGAFGLVGGPPGRGRQGRQQVPERRGREARSGDRAVVGARQLQAELDLRPGDVQAEEAVDQGAPSRPHDRDLGRGCRGTDGGRPGGTGLEPRGELPRVAGLLAEGRAHEDATGWTVRHDRRAPRPDDPRHDCQDLGDLRRRVPGAGEHVEDAGEKRPLFVDGEVLRSPEGAPAFGERRRRGNGWQRRAPEMVLHARRRVLAGTAPGHPPSVARGRPEVPRVRGARCSAPGGRASGGRRRGPPRHTGRPRRARRPSARSPARDPPGP